MTESSIDPRAVEEGAPLYRARWGTRLVANALNGATSGRIALMLPDGERIVIRGEVPGPEAHISISRWRALWRVFANGDVGFAESYRDGEWSSPDLLDVLRWAHANEDGLQATGRGARLQLLLRRLQHGSRLNTRANSRRNIKAHYDLGNAFYAAWLDSGMNYSSGLYAHPYATLEDAQDAKLARVTQLLDLHGGETVLEIGCGWGPLTERLVASYGARVTALTLSPRQRIYAEERLRARGLLHSAEIRPQDYRDVEGAFDRIASIEMLEAVGETYWPVYFGSLAQRLAPDGSAVLQVITIDPDRFARYRRRPDFIQTHIFPGGMLPTEDIIQQQAARAGLALSHRESFGPSYAATLSAWRVRFNANWPEIESQGFDARFKRLWNYYLAYCEAGFESGAIGVGLYRFAKA